VAAVRFAGGGERKIELDRRKIRRGSRREEDPRRSSAVWKRLRRVPVVALVGYTNSGKTTLFNRLSASREFAEDRLFATLDPRHARLRGVAGRAIVVGDTVGFLRKLPHQLVASFRSTLAEAGEADLLVHLVDASSSQAESQRSAVEEVLDGMGVPRNRVLLVYNKTDLPALPPDEGDALRISALSGAGLSELRAAVVARLEALGATIPRYGRPFS
jgi:GTP-binding protein HflX